jgi:hypothetical protein
MDGVEIELDYMKISRNVDNKMQFRAHLPLLFIAAIFRSYS